MTLRAHVPQLAKGMSCLLVAALLSACTLIPTMEGSNPIRNIHGAFCGPGRPAVSGTTREMLDQLSRIDATDDIDAVCKQHDICYTALREHNPYCDYALTEALLFKFTHQADEQFNRAIALQRASYSSPDNHTKRQEYLDADKAWKTARYCDEHANSIAEGIDSYPATWGPGDRDESLSSTAGTPVSYVETPVLHPAAAGNTKAQHSVPCNMTPRPQHAVFTSTKLFPLKLPHRRAKAEQPSQDDMCELQGILAYDITSARNSGHSQEETAQIANSVNTANVPTSVIRTMIERVYRNGSLNNFTLSRIQVDECLVHGQLASQSPKLLPVTTVSDKLENCQYISNPGVVARCVWYVLRGWI